MRASEPRTRSHGGFASEDWRPTWPAFDLNEIGASVATLVRVNRGPASALLAVLLAVLAVATSAGAFGLTDAAAGVGPGIDAGTSRP